MKATVDKEACIGCGICADSCPDVFEMNDESIAGVKVDSVPEEAVATCKEAAESCPVDAISLVD